MDPITAFISDLITLDGWGFFSFFVFCPIIMFFSSLIPKAKYYFLNFSYPNFVDTDDGLLDRWWTGFILGLILLAQIILLILFFYPLLLGIIYLFLAERYYLQNPQAVFFPLQIPVDSGQFLLIIGAVSIAIGFITWTKTMADVPKSAWLAPVIMKIDIAAFTLLCVLSLSITAFEAVRGTMPSRQFLTISIFIAAFSLLSAALRFFHLYSSRDFQYISVSRVGDSGLSRYPSGWHFRFSKMKASDKNDEEIKPTASEKANSANQDTVASNDNIDPKFRFSKLKDK